MLLEVASNLSDGQTFECCWKSRQQPGFLLPLSICYETPLSNLTENPQHPKRINSIAQKGQQPKEGVTPLNEREC